MKKNEKKRNWARASRIRCRSKSDRRAAQASHSLGSKKQPGVRLGPIGSDCDRVTKVCMYSLQPEPPVAFIQACCLQQQPFSICPTSPLRRNLHMYFYEI